MEIDRLSASSPKQDINMDTKYKVIDLFSGCGGMSLGFQKAGFDIVRAFDFWQPAIDVYQANFTHPIHKRDLSDTDDLLDMACVEADVVIGGPPCQDFSSAGHRDESLGRADLTASFTDIICKIKPEYFVMENVPRIQKSSLLADSIAKFKSAKYGLTKIVLDASFCGVPQVRKRFFLIGAFDSADDFLLDRLIKHQAKDQMTLFDYFGNSLGFEYYFRVPRSYQRRGIFSIHEPAMTVRGVDRPVPKGYPGHPGDPIKLNSKLRTLTVRERALIQTFPKTFKLEGSKTNLNQMIGNAVPVNLAKYVAKHLLAFMKQQSK